MCEDSRLLRPILAHLHPGLKRCVALGSASGHYIGYSLLRESARSPDSPTYHSSVGRKDRKINSDLKSHDVALKVGRLPITLVCEQTPK